MDNLLAAFTFFTRLPFWKIKKIPAASFKSIVPYWPLVGWLTGGIMAGVLWISAQLFPLSVAWMLAILARVLVTGCLHEDGLADFLDGFGGGTTREQTLSIMKDSHIGSYGVIGLIIYFLLLSQMYHLPLKFLAVLVLCGDCLAKFCASQLVNLLPYARREEESKLGVAYNCLNRYEWLISFLFGIVFLLILLPPIIWVATLFPLLVLWLLYRLQKRRLQGYTGDCCGAVFLLCELSFYIGSFALIHLLLLQKGGILLHSLITSFILY